MLITRFNRLFERHGRAAFLIIGIIIIVPFVFFVTPAQRGGGRKLRNRDSIGRMYGREIGREEFLDHMQTTNVGIFLSSGFFPSDHEQMQGPWFNETLRRMRGLHEAQKRGLDEVSDEEVIRVIRALPQVQKNGTFDPGRFAQFRSRELMRRGIDGAQFDAAVRRNIILDRLDAQVTAGTYVSPEEARAAFRKEKETFVVSYCPFDSFAFLEAAAGKPTEAEVSEYFSSHRELFRLPDQKRVRIATFQVEDFLAQVQVDPEAVRKQYDVQKARADRQQKTFESAKAEIEAILRRGEARKAAVAAAQQLREKLANAVPAEGGAGAVFSGVCKDLGIAVKDSGPFTPEGPMPNIAASARLQRQAHAVTAETPFSDVIYDGSAAHVACWLETIPGDVPPELTDAVRKDVEDRIIEDRARQFYEENVEARYREAVEAGKTPDEIRAGFEQTLAEQKDRTVEQKQAEREAFLDHFSSFLAPPMGYYVPEQKKARVVTFAPENFRSQVEVAEADIAAHYEANRAKYDREEVRARQILVRVPSGADDAQKAEKRRQLEDVLNRVREGTDFAGLALQYSEDTTTRSQGGDLGFFAASEKPKALADAAFALEPGEVSGIIELPTGYCLLRLEARRAGRTLAQATPEIREDLIEERAKGLAKDGAADFAYRAYEVLDAARVKSESVVDAFAGFAAAERLTARDTGWMRGRGPVPGFGFETELSQAAYALTASNFLSEAIRGKDGKWFVACLLETMPAYLPRFDTEPTLPGRVQRHMQREAALELAREKAASVYESLKAKLAEGTAFEDAIGDLDFQASAPFTRNAPPAGLPSGAEIVERVAESPEGTLLDPVDTRSGVVLVYVMSRQIPAEEEFETVRSEFVERVLQRKQNARLRAFYERLDEESQTELSSAMTAGRSG